VEIEILLCEMDYTGRKKNNLSSLFVRTEPCFNLQIQLAQVETLAEGVIIALQTLKTELHFVFC
jgi:hypothetical protein